MYTSALKGATVGLYQVRFAFVNGEVGGCLFVGRLLCVPTFSILKSDRPDNCLGKETLLFIQCRVSVNEPMGGDD